MAKIFIDLGPKQKKITEESIQGLVNLTPRRYKLSDSDRYGIKPPYQEGKDWAVWFPFEETFWNVFETLSNYPNWGKQEARNGNCYVVLQDTAELEEPPAQVVVCCDKISKYVGIRDCMAMSFALDYDHEDGAPQNVYSKVGQLRNLSKPRDGSQPSKEHYIKGGRGLAQLCVDFLSDFDCYQNADCIVAMPPSNPEKIYDLPQNLANYISKNVGIENLSANVNTVRPRRQLKDLDVCDRLAEIRETITVDNDIFKKKTVLLIDDVYQSGVSMNYVAMLLLEAGARKVFGLACDKTCRNKD